MNILPTTTLFEAGGGLFSEPWSPVAISGRDPTAMLGGTEHEARRVCRGNLPDAEWIMVSAIEIGLVT